MVQQVDNLKEVRPKKFLAVPRVWEKIVERLQEAERNSSPAKQMLMRWALAKGREHSELVLKHGPSQKGSLGYKLANRLVLRYVVNTSFMPIPAYGPTGFDHEMQIVEIELVV